MTATSGRELAADCSRCAALCCVALPFTASSDFAFDKRADEPCRHLITGFACGVHAGLRERGMRGCVVFDCFGAGQRVSQATFGGRHWRDDPAMLPAMSSALAVVRQLHEMLWHLGQAASLSEARPVSAALRSVFDGIDALADGGPEELAAVDVASLRREVGALLDRVSRLARAGSEGVSRRGADLVGARLAGTSFVGADLRGALLIAADLSGADLRRADLLGADLRDAVLDGADLSSALFLTQPQLESARGTSATALPAALRRPAHWGRG